MKMNNNIAIARWFKQLLIVCMGLLCNSQLVFAAVEEEAKRPINIAAVVTFVIFMILTLLITTWAARRTRSRKDYYAAGGDIGPIQNGFAIAGDTMSAASFLGLVGLIYVIG
ncbi:MAG: cation/acetate symporter, partial [Gammaproteobacteria bacterium]